MWNSTKSGVINNHSCALTLGAIVPLPSFFTSARGSSLGLIPHILRNMPPSNKSLKTVLSILTTIKIL